MRKRRMSKEAQIRLPDYYNYLTQEEIEIVIDAFFEALREMFEYNQFKSSDILRVGMPESKMKLKVKFFAEKRYTKRVLQNVQTGEKIDVPETKRLAKEAIIIEGIERTAIRRNSKSATGDNEEVEDVDETEIDNEVDNDEDV